MGDMNMNRIIAPTIARTSDKGDNPNAAKGRASNMNRPPRLTDGKRSGVTVTLVDPAYLRRYGASAAQAAADKAQRTGKPAPGGARVIGRNVPKRSLRSLPR